MPMEEMEGKSLANYVGIANGRTMGLLMAPWGGKTIAENQQICTPIERISNLGGQMELAYNLQNALEVVYDFQV
jgi:hypothetical protein